jgi:rubrerythrin
MSQDAKWSLSETNILNICTEVEDTVAILYRFFSKLFKDNETISNLFFKTSLEEDEHANQFRLASRLYGAGMKSVKTDTRQIESILKKIQSVYEAAQKSPPTLKEALGLSVKIEYALSGYHMNSIVVFDDPNLLKLFSSMKKNDDAHVQMLQQAFGSV